MENNNKKEGFTYTYSATEQEEIKRIRQKYQPKVDKMEQVHRLDARVNSKAISSSLAVGIIGALIMGSGMSLAMTELGCKLGMNGILSLIVGIVISIIGMTLAAFAYPIYKRVIKREREKIAPEILRLTEELMI